ncbi:Phospholipid-transporting ATPase 1, partial [Mucuna pruriens]
MAEPCSVDNFCCYPRKVHLAMDINQWAVFTHVAVWGSIVITYGGMVVLDSIPVFPNYGTIYHLASSPRYWMTILLIIIMALPPRFSCKLFIRSFLEKLRQDYYDQGFAQLLDVINKIKHNPADWQIILSSWDSADVKLMDHSSYVVQDFDSIFTTTQRPVGDWLIKAGIEHEDKRPVGGRLIKAGPGHKDKDP